MKITNRIVEAYLECKHKARLLLDGETGSPHEYELLMNMLAEKYRPKATAVLLDRYKLETAPTISNVTPKDLMQGPPLILDCTVEADQFKFHFDALRKLDGERELQLTKVFANPFSPQEIVQAAKDVTNEGAVLV